MGKGGVRLAGAVPRTGYIVGPTVGLKFSNWGKQDDFAFKCLLLSR